MGGRTTYDKPMTKEDPGCVLFLLDRSKSMEEPLGNVLGPAKQHRSAEAVNRAIRAILLRGGRGKGVPPRCDVGVIGYGGAGVSSAFGGKLRGRDLVSIAELAAHGAHEWVIPLAEGGTPMAEAFQMARMWIERWSSTHLGSFPPIVINVTDGEPYDAVATLGEACAVQEVRTDNGAALVVNIHLSGRLGTPLLLPGREDPGWDDLARLLFRMSSVLPECLLASARLHGLTPPQEARGYVYNADADTLIKAILFGSDPHVPRAPRAGP
jgi:hypothetical protein